MQNIQIRKITYNTTCAVVGLQPVHRKRNLEHAVLELQEIMERVQHSWLSN